MKNKFDKLIEYCSYLLYNFDSARPALDYLNNRLSSDAQKKFSFGYFPRNEELKLFNSSIGSEELFELHLLYEKNIENNSFVQKIIASPLEEHNLILPYRDVYGNIIAVVGRSLLADQQRAINGVAKYKNTSFSKSKHLFGLYEAKFDIIAKNCVYVVEGQFDCIQAHDKGLKNVVALGCSNVSFIQLALLLRYTDTINLLLDNDEAGQAGAEKALSKYGKYANIKVCKVPAGFKDLDELLVETTNVSSEELSKLLVG